METKFQLAIVIPAYKAEFLAEALSSLAAQTDKRFKVYVGDDASPGPIKDICAPFQDKFDLVYQRFSENLGRESLVDQWHRCIELSSEPWIWLFSDDDIIEPGCVEAFYDVLDQAQSNIDLYRFNSLNIDEFGRIVQICPPHPPIESGVEFAYHSLCGNRLSFVSEYIFSRKVFEENGGMVKFPLAWCSDDASWITFAGIQGIFTIYGPKVCWRKSQVNISFAAPAHRWGKLEACGLYLAWLNQKYTPEIIINDLNLDSQIFQKCQKMWLLNQIRNQAPLGPRLWMRLAKNQQVACLGSPISRFISMMLIDLVFIMSRAADMLRKRI